MGLRLRPALDWRLRGLGRRAAWAALAGLALIPAAAQADFYFLKTREAVAKDLLYPSPLLESEWLGGWLRERTAPADLLWVYGSEPALYVYAGRRAAKPAYVVYVNQPISTLYGSVLGLSFRDAVRAWLAADYRLEGYVPVPREPDTIALIAASAPDWSAQNRLYVFRRAGRKD